jgi:DNA-directed RNA polymerase subunit M/transcription elongation factor TFIIS
MSSASTQATQHNTDASGLKVCSECGGSDLVWLVQLRRVDANHDWYRCRNCGHESAFRRLDAPQEAETPT